MLSPISVQRTKKGHRQSDEHWYCFKGNVGKLVRDALERSDGHFPLAHVTDTILTWTELCVHSLVRWLALNVIIRIAVTVQALWCNSVCPQLLPPTLNVISRIAVTIVCPHTSASLSGQMTRCTCTVLCIHSSIGYYSGSTLSSTDCASTSSFR